MSVFKVFIRLIVGYHKECHLIFYNRRYTCFSTDNIVKRLKFIYGFYSSSHVYVATLNFMSQGFKQENLVCKCSSSSPGRSVDGR